MQSDIARRGLAAALGLTLALAPMSLRAEELTGTLKKVKDANAIVINNLIVNFFFGNNFITLVFDYLFFDADDDMSV